MKQTHPNQLIRATYRTLIFVGLMCLSYNHPIPARADTTPEIDYAPSSIQNGQSVTIGGHAFGTKYPVEPLQWDDFEDDEIGANLVGSNPVIGSPWSSSGPSPIINDAKTHSGSRGAFVNFDQGVTRFRYAFNPHTDKVFMSWWRFHESDPEEVVNDVYCNPPFIYGQPGYDPNDCHNYKMLYLMGDQGSNNLEPQLMIGAIMTSRQNWQHAIQGGVFSEYNNTWNYPYSYSATLNQWQRWDTYSQMETGDFTLNNGILDAWISGRKVLERHTYDYGTVSSNWQDVGIGALFRPESAYTMFQSYFDDIYIDNTQARVEICGSITWTDRELNESHCEIQIPHTTWNDGQIQFTVNQGTFTDSESAYLYVVDENGVVNTTGYPITFGGIASNIPPVLAGIGNKSLHEQETLTFNVLASDDDPEDTLTLSASNLPEGATFTDNGGGSGTFSWTPTDQQSNVYPNIHFEVTDGTDTDTEDITITVLDGIANCTPAWECSNWSVCTDSLQTRSCDDHNLCGSDAGRPVETAPCDSTAPGVVVDLMAS